MIRHIIGKEILENVLSLRFVLSLLLTVPLFAANGVISARRYEKRLQEYSKQTNRNVAALSEQSQQLWRLAFHRQEIYRRPRPLTCCVEGFERSLPNCIRFNAFTSDLPEIGGQSNFTLPPFSDIDWVFITSLVLSFVALAFTYDSLCGEKEAGTLALMLAGAIPRYKLLLAKYVAAMLTLCIPLCIGLLASLLVMVSSRSVAFTPGEWLKILVIVLLSFLYLSAFVLLGLLVSGRTTRPANSMVILLLLWVGLIVLTPSLGRIISDVSAKGTTQVELRRRLDEASRQVDDQAEAGAFGENPGVMSTDLDDPANNPPARARFRNAQTNARDRVIEAHHRALLAQVAAGWNLTCFSPAVIYRRAAEAIAGTGIGHCVSLRRQVLQYQGDLMRYIRDTDSQDPNSLHLICADEGCAWNWGAISHQPADFADVPRFRERDLSPGRAVQSAIWDIGLLLLFNLVFFAAAFTSFLRYDVR